jgi:hypothetical protein
MLAACDRSPFPFLSFPCFFAEPQLLALSGRAQFRQLFASSRFVGAADVAADRRVFLRDKAREAEAGAEQPTLLAAEVARVKR